VSRYAENTEVPVDRSKAEIEKILMRYGADQFVYGTMTGRAMIAFRVNAKFVRFTLPLPDPGADEFKRTPTGRTRKKEVVSKEYAQEIRRRWRALSLSIDRTGIRIQEDAGGATVFAVNCRRLQIEGVFKCKYKKSGSTKYSLILETGQ